MAHDRTDGARRWAFTVPSQSVPGARPRPTLAEVHDDAVFVLAGASEGTWTKRVFVEVYALDASSGRQRWAQRIEGSHIPVFAGASMLVEGGQVIVAYNDVLVALAAASGEPQWSQGNGHGDSAHMPLIQLSVPGARARQLL
ncbi:PQQ-like beta-propeller repeat protein [Corallococcus sp. M34]|uniref:outer membrane protein assembly factor BamB family protein n=1 Tax=Citreicoccus inhibens TaxID=2849499 RepID=UPI00131554D2|nr:PQQ-binding-like beta-propeller repeat protein [Citreicoccus inhibens]MBU8893987.1 PQQ-like beta-propeller repeat protein [Citreicoccus inhibens]